SNGESTQDISALIAGDYTVTVTDANGCTATETITITEPDELTLSYTPVNVSCFGGSNGSIDLSVTGGTGSYTYAWSNGESTQEISTLIAGDYTVTVTDANGCTATETITFTEPDELILSYTPVNVSCFGESNGSIDLSVTGGTGFYTYAWSNGESTQDISTLIAGDYTVTVTDTNGC